MLELFVNEWAAAAIALLSATVASYIWASSNNNAIPMGAWFHKFTQVISYVCCLLLIASVVFMSYSYSWYFLPSIFVFVVLGSLLWRFSGSLTQVALNIGMPL